jgi:superfamily I DNA/RNA helicase
MEEEKKLMYVGVTRAEEKLLLPMQKKTKWGEYRYYHRADS